MSQKKSAAVKPVATTQDVCIDLPGEAVKCWRSSDHIKLILRKHRDVIFDVNLSKGATYTVESTFVFYSPREKKLLRKAQFEDGEIFQIWVGREFKGSLVLKSNGIVMGTFQPIDLDTRKYDAEPKTKPEPMMVIFGKREVPSNLICRPEDPYGVESTQGALKPMFDPKLAVLKSYGTEFDYRSAMEPPEVAEYVAVAIVSANDIQPQVLKQLDSGQAVEGSITEVFNPPGKNSPDGGLYGKIAAAVGTFSNNYFINANWLKEPVGYLQSHWKDLDKALMKVRIEKRAVGKYQALFKGRLLGKSVAQFFGSAVKAKVTHKTFPLGSKETTFLDGGFGRNGRAGFGGIKRLMLTTSDNLRGGVKVTSLYTTL
ncbi:hypothetical protein [Massilia sp. S19_KUP03_FR1]|uniref:hypothetical protein n=1 Tax=Massilia sp. S19_KUP03_FR1 TaxID=3025503 RepID=UPI002FCDD545